MGTEDPGQTTTEATPTEEEFAAKLEADEGGTTVPPETSQGGETVGSDGASTDDKTPAETPSGKVQGEPAADAEDRATKIAAAAAAREKRALDKEREAKLVIDRAKKVDQLRDPDKALEVLLSEGLTPKQIVDAMVRRNGADAPKTPEERIAEIERREQEREQRQATEQAQARRNAALTHLTSIIDAAPERFDVIRHLGRYDLVAEKIGAYYRKFGEEPDYLEIADACEQHLEKTELAKLKNSKKLAKLFTPAETPPQGTARTATPGTKTLNNGQSGRVPSKDDDLPGMEDGGDARQEAVARRLGIS